MKKFSREPSKPWHKGRNGRGHSRFFTFLLRDLWQMTDRVITPQKKEEDLPLEGSLRPRTLAEYIGQERLKENLAIFIAAAKGRSEPLDHVLFHGFPGLGKTSLAAVISNELNSNLRSTSGARNREGRRPGSDPYQSRGGRRSFHRRNPPVESRRRGNSLPGDGGFQARHHHWPRPIGSDYKTGPASIHSYRRYHPRGSALTSSARPVRRFPAARVLQPPPS